MRILIRALSIVCLAIFVFSQSSFSAKELDPVSLLKGARAPERREFPLSTTVSPCENFHQYVCGEVEKKFVLPKDRSVWTFSFNDSSERILQAKKNYFKALQSGYVPKDPKLRNVKKLFTSCLNVNAKKIEEKVLVQKHMREIFSLKDKTQLKKMMAEKFLSPNYSFVEFFDIPNQGNPNRNDIAMLVDGLSLPEKKDYEDEKKVQDLFDLAEAFFKELGLDQPATRAKKFVEFEKALAKTYLSPSEFRQIFSENTIMTRSQFIEKYPQIPFESAFSKIPEETKIRNITKDAFAFLNDYVLSASVKDMQNILLINTVSDKMDDSYPKFFKKSYAFKIKYFGAPPQRPDRFERCTRTVSRNLGMELDADLLPILFKSFEKEKVIEVAEAIRQSLIKSMEQNQWLSNDGKKEAILKLQKAKLKLVQPDQEKDWNFLELKDLNDKNVLSNLEEIKKASIQKMLKELSSDRNRDRWEMSPLVVNAYFAPADNQFVLTQGILQYPFFDLKQSFVENIAAIGSVVGHELGHGIDDQGAKYDSDGKLRQWMTMKDLAEFTKRGQGFVKRFNEANHNGQLTLGENIGDHVGISAAFSAAFPGDVSKADLDQMKKFFVSYARSWCEVMTPEARQSQIKTDPHALGYARINEQVKHLEGFHKAYSCKPGDKMFLPSEDRIRVW